MKARILARLAVPKDYVSSYPRNSGRPIATDWISPRRNRATIVLNSGTLPSPSKMSSPRGLTALEEVARKYRRNRTGGVVALAIILVLLGYLQTAPAVAQTGTTVLLGFFVVMLFAVLLIQLLSDVVPQGFSRAERVKYRLARLLHSCEKYQKVYTDPRERRVVAGRCRRAADRLLRSVRPFTPERITTSGLDIFDLFSADLSEFSAHSSELARRLGALVKGGYSLSEVLMTSLKELLAALENDPVKMGNEHRQALEFATSAARQTADVLDDTLGLDLGQLFRQGLSRNLTGFTKSLSPLGQAILLMVATVVILWLTFAASPLANSLSLDIRITISIGTLSLVTIVWSNVRRKQ